MVSIRTRLTLFYSIAIFCFITISIVILYWASINLLYKADYEFLTDQMETIQYLVADSPMDLTALKQAVLEVPRSPSNSIYRYYIRVFDAKAKVLIETPGMKNILNPTRFYHESLKTNNKISFYWYKDTTHKDYYLLLQAPLHLSNTATPGFTQILVDISYQHTILQDRKNLIFSFSCAFLFSLIVGYFIAYRGTRSLYKLTETVKKITASSLDKRINPKYLPKELQGLGTAFNQMLERLESAILRLKQFSADLSHELRTPISNLIGQTEVALTYGKTTEDLQRTLTSNLEEYQRISSLIDNLLFLARAENPLLVIKKQKIFLAEEINKLIDYYQAMADEKNITITLQGDAQLYVDSALFQRLLANLLSNAIKYNKEGGQINIQIKQIDDNIQLTIMDTGIGIAKDNIHKLFDRFYRADQSRNECQGFGLGLPIVKSIVLLHQGQIEVESELDTGTTFKLHFPIQAFDDLSEAT